MKFKRHAEGVYDVIVDGETIGYVRRRRESYTGIRSSRGRRMGTYTYWDAYRGAWGSGAEAVARGAHTRYEAVEALLR